MATVPSSSQPPAPLAVIPPAARPGWMVRYGAMDSPQDTSALEDAWQRPSHWLPLPELDPDEEKFVGLAAIFPGAATTLAVGASGNFHVDWGDGSHQDVLSPTPAIEWWNWSTYRWYQASELELPLLGNELPWLNLLPESITVRYGGLSGFLPSTAYRLELREDNRVMVVLDPPLWTSGIGYMFEIRWKYSTTELVPTVVRHRYVHDNPLLAGTETARGYRQAIVTVTPQAGQRLTALRLQDGPADPESSSSWLDVAIASPVLSELRIGKRW
jgi:hypothetical protein